MPAAADLTRTQKEGTRHDGRMIDKAQVSLPSDTKCASRGLQGAAQTGLAGPHRPEAGQALDTRLPRAGRCRCARWMSVPAASIAGAGARTKAARSSAFFGEFREVERARHDGPRRILRSRRFGSAMDGQPGIIRTPSPRRTASPRSSMLMDFASRKSATPPSRPA